VVGERKTDSCQVVANGLGLQKGLTGRPNMFSVNARYVVIGTHSEKTFFDKHI